MSDSTQWFESLRVSYEQGELNEADITHNPFEQFNNWLQEAIKNEVPEPNAMVLATVNKDGQPGAILVASASFWEGVDIAGDALQLVVFVLQPGDLGLQFSG